MTDTTPKTRWYRITPGRLLFLLLIIEVVLWFYERFERVAFNPYKGLTLVIALASVGLTMLVMFFWFLGAAITRHRFQFSIRFLLLLVLIMAIPCSWLAIERAAATKQEKLVLEIEKAGGSVEYDDQREVLYGFAPLTRSPVPAWLGGLLGYDLFRNVTRVDLAGSKVSDEELRRLEGLGQLQALVLQDTGVRDAGLEHLTPLKQLLVLDLSGTKITDAGLMPLEGLTQLQVLVLRNTDVSDIGLKHLKGLTRLQALNLSGTKVSDVGLESLKGLSQLESLRLEGTDVGDAGLQHLKELRGLLRLELSGTHVTAGGVERLQQAVPCRVNPHFLNDRKRVRTPPPPGR